MSDPLGCLSLIWSQRASMCGGFSPSKLDFHVNYDSGTQESWLKISHQQHERLFTKKHQQYICINPPHAVAVSLAQALALYTGRLRHVSKEMEDLFIKTELTYNSVLVSGVQKSDSVLYIDIHVYIF